MDMPTVQHDVMHSQFLGTGNIVNGRLESNMSWSYLKRPWVLHIIRVLIRGSILIYLTEAGRWDDLFGSHGDGKCEDKLCPLLRTTHPDFRNNAASPGSHRQDITKKNKAISWNLLNPHLYVWDEIDDV